MKRIVFFLLILLGSINLNAQKRVAATPSQSQMMLEKITDASAKIQSLVCDFEQVKVMSILNEKMTSNGKMYYRNDNSLCWEYTSPYTYTFVLNNNKIMLQAENGKKNVIDIKSNRFFQEIVKMMMNSINGNGLKDIKSFKINYYWGDAQWEIHLVPIQKEMKKMFSNIRMTLNTKDYTVDKVEMDEQNGDTTTIFLKNKKFNGKIENKKFIID